MNKTTVSIQGQTASFHDQAAKKYFGDYKTRNCKSFKDVFSDVADKKSDYGVVAIENSLYGSINEVYDLLARSGCQIVGEVYLQIHHCLISLSDAELNSIKQVYSQKEALGQCSDWLDVNLPTADLHATHDTAGSLELVDTNAKAAIASELAADHYGLKILARNIETHHHNYTRFIIIALDNSQNSDANKSSIMLRTANKPGALLEVLQFFNDASINLIKLESRPIVGQPWEYMFYLDFEASAESSQAKELLSKLDTTGHDVHLLGSYKSDVMPK